MKVEAMKLIYTSCLFSFALGALLCGAIITANKLNSDLTPGLTQQRLAAMNPHHEVIFHKIHQG